jgi:hypothetical protein
LVGNLKNPKVLIPILIILAPLLYSVFGFVSGQNRADSLPFLEVPTDKFDSCVRDTEYMRYRHMELLREIRVKVVRDGVRDEMGLEMCKGCHVNRKEFCSKCHTAANVMLDCFTCHYYPETPEYPDPGEKEANDG